MPDSSRLALSVGLILGERFTLSAFANFVDVLRLAADEGDRSRPIRCRWAVLSSDMAPVRSSCGVSIGPNERLGNPSRFDYVVVVGGLLDDIGRLSPDYVTFLRHAAYKGVPLVGLCTGAFLLHDAGLMQGYRCCVSWFHHGDFLERFEGIEPVSDRIFVVDRDRLTCSGGASAAHLAAHLVDRHIGTSAARKSLHIMIIDDAMPADEPQPSLPSDLHTRDPLVRRAILYMQQAMDSAPSVTRIAEAMQVSRRKLERHFIRTIALTPSEAFLRLRLSHARLLLETSKRSVAEIAAETGFCDGSHLARIFREREGLTPDAWRRSAAASVRGAAARE